VLTALALRLVVVAFVYQDFLVPGRDHWEFGYELGKIASSISSGHGFSNPYWIETGPTAMITPIYPYLLGAIFSVFGAYTKAAALTVLGFNCLVSALTCIPIFFLAQNSFGRRTALGACWAWAFFPYAIYFSASSMWYHSLVALLLTALLLTASYLETRTRLWMWAAFGALWGLTALTTPVVLAVLPFTVGWVCYRLHGNGKSWKLPAATAALALFITIAPWAARNYQVFHRPVFLKDNFWMEVCIGNLGNAQHWWNDAAHPAGNKVELAAFQQLGELGYMARERRQALAFIANNPGIFLWRSVRRFIYMWTGFWSLNREYLREEPLDLWNTFFCTIFTALAMTGLFKALKNRRQAAMPYALVLLSFPLVYYFTHSEISYRLPIEPALVIFAAFAIASRRTSVPVERIVTNRDYD
jgi:4-amino-4-deoxy-L-arabinose transferase-like glycosyltransferase